MLVEGLHDVGDGVAAADGVGPLLPVQVLPSPTATHLHFANLKNILGGLLLFNHKMHMFCS